MDDWDPDSHGPLSSPPFTKEFTSKKCERLQLVSRLGVRLLRQMIVGSASLAAVLQRYVPMMFQLDGMKLHVADIMPEFFAGNTLFARSLREPP